jgi:hypothetical protein
MSNHRHTPGPWEVDRYYWTLQRRLFGDDEPEVQIIGRISETEDDEREANARLIAAAPELLEALKECERELSTVWARQGQVNDNRHALAARAAIAKATQP